MFYNKRYRQLINWLCIKPKKFFDYLRTALSFAKSHKVLQVEQQLALKWTRKCERCALLLSLLAASQLARKCYRTIQLPQQELLRLALRAPSRVDVPAHWAFTFRKVIQLVEVKKMTRWETRREKREKMKKFFEIWRQKDTLCTWPHCSDLICLFRPKTFLTFGFIITKDLIVLILKPWILMIDLYCFFQLICIVLSNYSLFTWSLHRTNHFYRFDPSMRTVIHANYKKSETLPELMHCQVKLVQIEF